MNEQPTGKPCVICGEDCTGQPRTKDAKGNYYHQRCYEAARRAKAAQEAAAAAPPHAAPELEEPDPFGLLDEVLDDAAPGAAFGAAPGAAAAAAIPAGQMCPGCAMAVTPGAVLCTSCGFNLQTGGHVAPTTMAAPMKVGGGGGGGGEGRVWPVVIGVISIVFGACGLLAHGYSVVSSFAIFQTAGTAFGLGALAAPTLMLLVAAWLLLAGIGVLRRRQEAAVQIRRWAIVKTILYGTCLGCVTIGLVVGGNSGAFAEGLGDGAGQDISGLGMGMLVAIIFAVFGWFLLWPIFILIWFGRATVQAQVGRW